MFAHDIKIAGVTLPFDAAWQLSQTYETLGGRALLRTLNGTGVLQSHWSKVRTVIRGQGRYPDALSAVNWATSISIECAAPLGIHSAGTAVTLPAARRTDWAPFAQAVVDGRTVPTSLSIAVNAGTLGAVAGATSYITYYFPILACYAVQAPSRSFDGRVAGQAGWELIAEEA